MQRLQIVAALVLCASHFITAASLAQSDPEPGSNPGEFQPAPPSSTTRDARTVLERIRPAVVQVTTLLDTNSAQTSHGTAFAVAPGGIFMTNYHVVAQHVNHPERYRLEYKTFEGKTGGLAVLAVDVRHDLALIRSDGFAPAPLVVRPGIPTIGERAFSVGFPLDVGLTITEGVLNGKVQDSFNPRIHYSGALNAGMSGGPTLDEDANVVGVNVSSYVFSQMVNFVVPGEHAAALLNRAPSVSPDTGALKADIVAQMHSHSLALLEALSGSALPTEVSSGYRLPARLAPFVDCAASGNVASKQPVQMTSVRCSAKSELYIDDGLISGTLNFVHNVLTTKDLDAWRFAKWQSGMISVMPDYRQRKHVGPFACEDRVVALKGFDANVVTCVRAYRSFGDLYDFVLQVSSLDGTDRGFVTNLKLNGVEFAGGMDFLRRFLGALEATRE